MFKKKFLFQLLCLVLCLWCILKLKSMDSLSHIGKRTQAFAPLKKLSRSLRNKTFSTELNKPTEATSAKNPMVTIDDVTITIKSSKKFHNNRVKLLLRTWVKRVLNQVRHFFKC